MSRNITRPQILKFAAQMAILAPFASVTAEPLPLLRWFAAPPPIARPAPYRLTAADNRLLDEMERMACRYFWEQASPKTGLVKDRARPTLQDRHYIASIAATAK